MALMAFTGMRRSDAVLIGPSHVKEGVLRFTPHKTRGSTGTELTLPSCPNCRRSSTAASLARRRS